MKKVVFSVAFIATSLILVTSCNKNKCHECHYDDASGNEIPLGEKCGDEVETLEANGYAEYVTA